MIHYEFKTCISDGMELYGFVQEEANGQRVMSTRNARFPQSLLSFLDFDIEQIRLAFQPLSDGVRKVIAEKSREESDRVCQMFAGLTNYHPYFVLLFLDWRYRLDRAWYLGYEFPQNYLQVEYLDEMPDNLERLQRQALDLLTHIWVKDTSDRSVDEKMTAYYLEAEQVEKDVFRFRPQKMSYELMYRQTFAEFLCPDTVYDLIDYHLRECLKREIKMRRCKNCGRLFAVTGHGGTEYCDRPADERGRTCREIGAFRVWEKSKSTDEPFKVFRREYKKRFAWIKAGRITKDEFYSWSERAREKRDKCDAGRITLEEFEAWLKQS
jgi:hypothetical protein